MACDVSWRSMIIHAGQRGKWELTLADPAWVIWNLQYWAAQAGLANVRLRMGSFCCKMCHKHFWISVARCTSSPQSQEVPRFVRFMVLQYAFVLGIPCKSHRRIAPPDFSNCSDGGTSIAMGRQEVHHCSKEKQTNNSYFEWSPSEHTNLI